MCENSSHPIIFPLSNPNTSCEANPADLIHWSRGKAICATGSPYPDAEYEGKTYSFSQCNNAYIFPGVGLGVIASETKKISDLLFEIAAETLSVLSPHSSLFPQLVNLREVSEKIAFAVAKAAIAEGLAKPRPDEELLKRIQETAWKPTYPVLNLT